MAEEYLPRWQNPCRGDIQKAEKYPGRRNICFSGLGISLSARDTKSVEIFCLSHGFGHSGA